jgi:predicted N-acetyltransferase YhbS
MFNVVLYENSELSRDQIVAIVSLLNSIWPNKEKTVTELVETFLERHHRYLASYPRIVHPSIRYLASSDGQLVGHAFTFERPVISDGVEISVMALSGVSVPVTHRGKGIGVALARSAFERVGNSEFPVSLFQTTIPAFYRKLGATAVDNRFFNSRNQSNPDANPWNDGWVMAYPSGYAWPKGPVDLNGPGY